MLIKDYPNYPSPGDNDLLLIWDAVNNVTLQTTKQQLLADVATGGNTSGMGANPWILKTSNYAANPGARIIADTANNAWSLTLPSVNSPCDIEILGLDSVATNPLTIEASTFEGNQVNNLSLGIPYRSVKLTYINSFIGWVSNPANIVTPNYPFNLSDLPGLALSINSSQGIIKNDANFVSQWNDQSGLSNNLFQLTPSLQPTYNSSSFNNFPTIDFSNGTKFFDFNSINNIRSIYWVIKGEVAGESWLLGHNSSYDFHSQSNCYFDGSYSSISIRQGKFKLNSNPVAPTSQRSEYMSTLSLVTLNNIAASSLSADRNNQYGARSWRGKLLELLIYTSAHTDEQVIQVENYLKAKYNHY